MAEINGLQLNFTPEAKEPMVKMPFQGNYTQEMYTQQIIDEYTAAGINPSRVWLQSFVLKDILYWLRADPAFGKQALYLDNRVDTPAGYKTAVADMQKLADQGVQVISPPIASLLSVDSQGKIVPSDYAIAAKAAGLKIITWSLERSGFLSQVKATKDYYYASFASAIKQDGDMYTVVDVLAQQVGILGLFSDWPATVTYYANCMGLGAP
ncbi:hypothetical protein B0A49_02024 [Cryomyces minteri]|uniref:GP-PDE domain-containing protein n=1 Tax=Cryomyces minteri TaxID=331657 RepID=A0A4U0XJD2_9PEZI|nr:hypothetical protein B0A49_02024 [Cryomyces minteri]